MDPALFAENERTAPAADGRRTADLGPYTTVVGAEIPAVSVAYEEWGPPEAPAILVCHALSGDSHATGPDGSGWWSRLVGPGRAIDTDRFRVVCSNVLGGCQGTTGPGSPHPHDGRPYGSRFPKIAVADMVRVQARLLDRLGIETLHCVAGGSMGGMQALEWPLRHPDRVERVFATATAARHSAMQIGFNEVARQAIERDPKWRGGDYEGGEAPDDGLAVARMLGHLTFLSPEAFESKFARRRQRLVPESEFAVESYLRHQGEKFTRRFDARSLVTLTRAIDAYEALSFAGSRAKYLSVGYTSDWIYPQTQAEEIARLARDAGCDAEYLSVDLPYGHDAFLLDGELQAAALRSLLA